MAFPDNWVSIKNPENVDLSTITPIFLINNAPMLPGTNTTGVLVPTTQAYTIYARGAFVGTPVEVEWSLDNITFKPFLSTFDNAPVSFTEQGYSHIPRIAAGVFVRLINQSEFETDNITVTLQ